MAFKCHYEQYLSGTGKRQSNSFYREHQALKMVHIPTQNLLFKEGGSYYL
jgi:hypothetical protein